MEKTENLWGNITPDIDVDSPKSILNQQAKYLTDMTNKFLVGEVRTALGTNLRTYGSGFSTNDPNFGQVLGIKKNSPTPLRYELLIKAPSLSYQFVLLSVQYNLKGYPIILTNELEEQNIEVANEQEFKNNLSQILKSPTTNRALSTLLSHNNKIKQQTSKKY